MIHGHTRIVLRNPISGNILKDIESENTFQTTVMQQATRQLGTRGGCPYYSDYNRSQSMWKSLVGGIFLFENSIPVGDLYMSAGNKMIGNGSYGIVNAEAPNEMGSFNSQESSESSSAITQVYDFATNQANGRISCVALTSQVGGYMGYGNPSGQSKLNALYPFSKNQDLKTPNPWYTADYIDYDGNRYGYDAKARRIVCGNKEYFIILAGSELVVNEWKLPITKGSVFDGFKKQTVIDISNLHYNTFTGNRIWCSLDDGKYYIADSGNNGISIAAGATKYYLELDLANLTVTEKSFTNPLSTTLNGWFTVCCGVIAIANGRTAEFFDKESGVHIKSFDYGTNRNQMMICNGGNGLIRICSYGYCDIIYDKVNDTIFPTNTTPTNAYNQSGTTYDPFSNSLVMSSRGNTEMYPNPLYLATINNLNSPVTKTAAQTMKVTYTLTEA